MPTNFIFKNLIFTKPIFIYPLRNVEFLKKKKRERKKERGNNNPKEKFFLPFLTMFEYQKRFDDKYSNSGNFERQDCTSKQRI